MKKRLLLIVLPVAALILELLPYGAVLNFANPSEDGTIGHIRETFSYFDPVVFGNANFGPMLTAIITCVILLLAVVYVLTKVRLIHTILRILSVASLVTSIMPMMFGTIYLSPVGLAITAALLGEAILLANIENE